MNKGLMLIEHQPFSAIDKIWFTNYDCAILFIAIMAFFYFLYNRKVWLLTTSLICLLIVSGSITFQKIKSTRTQSITFYSLSKHSGILFKNGGQGVLLSDLSPADVNYKYAIQPAIDSNRVENVSNINLESNIETPYLRKHSALIQFLNNKILIYNPRLVYVKLPQKLELDYLYITGNPHTSLAFIGQNYTYKKLIIDGTNSTPNIKKLVSEADNMNIKYAVLKRNNSVIVTSN